MISQKARAMYAEYGMSDIGGLCRECCNLHYKDKPGGERVCIAYGNRADMNCAWEPQTSACGLFNNPFRALRPARRPLVELIAPKHRAEDTPDPMQESLF